MELLIVFICGFIAFAISAICGGGAGLLLIPILGNYLPVTQVPAALSIGTATSSVSRIIFFFKNIKWKIVAYFLPTALPAAWLGSWLLAYVNPLWLELVMSLFLISNLPQVFRKKEKELKKSLPSWVLLVIGLLAGFISGITGAVGLLFNKFYLRFGLTNNEIVATRAMNEVLLHIVKLILYIQFGLFTLSVLKIGITVAVAAILSSWVMKKVLPKISVQWFHKLGYSAMVLSGFIMLFGFFSKAQQQKNADFYTSFANKGFDTHLSWAEDNYNVEFRWDEGFEFEKVISYQDLPTEKKSFVDSQTYPHTYRIIEIVHTFLGTSYEVYYLDKNKNIIHQLDF